MIVKIKQNILIINCNSLDDFNLSNLKDFLILNKIKYTNRIIKCLFNGNVATIQLTNDLRKNNKMLINTSMFKLKDILIIYDKEIYKNEAIKIYKMAEDIGGIYEK